jgi:8-oxo-dGTP diphosphatase
MTNTVHVAAGVILNASGEVLLALRPLDKHQGGLWEFPGGKVEAGEPVRDALARELLEELNLSVVRAEPLLVTEHDYGDKRVRLDVWVVREFGGIPHGREGQTIRWCPVVEIGALRFPAANLPIVKAVMALA